VTAAEPHDAAQVNVVVRLGAAGQGARLLARVTRKSWEALGAGLGDPVHAQVKSVALVAAGSLVPGRSVGAPSPVLERQDRVTVNWRNCNEDQRTQHARG
jgi:TOBE domain